MKATEAQITQATQVTQGTTSIITLISSVLFTLIASALFIFNTAAMAQESTLQENMQDMSPQAISGQFVDADRFHTGEGSFEIVEEDGQRILKFSEEFNVTRGPDLFVWLTKGDNTKEFVNLGRLENRKGTQSYIIPEDVNLDDFDRVIIWCRAFSVLFATGEFPVASN